MQFVQRLSGQEKAKLGKLKGCIASLHKTRTSQFRVDQSVLANIMCACFRNGSFARPNNDTMQMNLRVRRRIREE